MVVSTMSGPVTVFRILGDQISAEHAVWRASPALRTSVVDCLGNDEVVGRPLVRRWVPAASVTVMIGFGEAGESIPLDYTVGTKPPSKAPSSLVIGMHQRAVISESRGCKMIQVEFTPLAAYTLFGLPLRELAGQFVELPQVWGQPAGELAERLAEVPDWPGRFAAVEGEIARRLADGPAAHKEVAWAYQRIHRSHGRVNIAELAAEVGWSRRHLTRRFGEQLGLAPKTVARLRRLRNVLCLLRRPGRRSIADIAAHCGYYDQAHLDLDFRDIAGCSPKEYLAEVAAERVRADGDPAS